AGWAEAQRRNDSRSPVSPNARQRVSPTGAPVEAEICKGALEHVPRKREADFRKRRGPIRKVETSRPRPSSFLPSCEPRRRRRAPPPATGRRRSEGRAAGEV